MGGESSDESPGSGSPSRRTAQRWEGSQWDLPPYRPRITFIDTILQTNCLNRSVPVDMENPAYGFKRVVNLPLEEADRRVREELQKEGFGILTEIDVKATLKKKLDVDFKPYRILGACNPPLAHRALSAEEDIGLLLPCNVVVYEGDSPESTVVAVINPEVQLGITGRKDISPLADEVGERMKKALDAL